MNQPPMSCPSCNGMVGFGAFAGHFAKPLRDEVWVETFKVPRVRLYQSLNPKIGRTLGMYITGPLASLGRSSLVGWRNVLRGAVEWASLGAVGIRFSAHKAMLHRCGEFYVHAALIMWISNGGLRKDSGGGHVGTRRGAVVVHGSPYLRHYYLSQLRLIGT